MHFLNIFTLLLFTSCAYVHHTQIGDIDNTKNYLKIPIEIKVSETGVNLQELSSIAQGTLRDKNLAEDFETITAIISLFQMGPKTGKPVWSGDEYADGLLYMLYEKCPQGRITNLMSVRETSSYPVVSGEIVKIRGMCLRKRTRPRGT